MCKVKYEKKILGLMSIYYNDPDKAEEWYFLKPWNMLEVIALGDTFPTPHEAVMAGEGEKVLFLVQMLVRV